MQICHVLVKCKDFLGDKNYVMFKSYTTQKLMHQLLTDYGSKISRTNEINEGQVLYISSMNISGVFELAADYKKMLHENNNISSEKLLD